MDTTILLEIVEFDRAMDELMIMARLDCVYLLSWINFQFVFVCIDVLTEKKFTKIPSN